MLGRSYVAFLRWAFLAVLVQVVQVVQVVFIAVAWHTLLIHRGADVAGAAQLLLGDHRWWPWHLGAFLLVHCDAFRGVVLLHHSVIVPDADFFCCICAFFFLVLLRLISGLLCTDISHCGVTEFDVSTILNESGGVVAIPLYCIFADLLPPRVANFLVNIAAIGLGLRLWGSMAYNSKEEKVEKDEHPRPRRQFSDLRPPRLLSLLTPCTLR